MVTVTFSHKGRVLGTLGVQDGAEPEITGDLAWLTYEFTPYSERLGHEVAFAWDPEEWARCLPAAYTTADLEVTATENVAPLSSLTSPTEQLHLAGFGRRAGAFIVDFVLELLPGAVPFFLAVPIVEMGARGGTAKVALFAVALIISFLIGICYWCLVPARAGVHNGQTYGKQMFGIRIVRDDGRPVTAGLAFRRNYLFQGVLSWCTLGWASFAGPLWMLGDGTNRTLHDILADTHVVLSSVDRAAHAAAYAPIEEQREPHPESDREWILVACMAGLLGVLIVLGCAHLVDTTLTT